jgi:hypothetical protein
MEEHILTAWDMIGGANVQVDNIFILPASACISLHQPASACVSLCQPASACASLCQPASACISLSQPASRPTKIEHAKSKNFFQAFS